MNSTINTDGLGEKDFEALATQLAAARAMLAALKQVRARWTGSAYRSPTMSELNAVGAAIAQAEAAGIK